MERNKEKTWRKTNGGMNDTGLAVHRFATAAIPGPREKGTIGLLVARVADDTCLACHLCLR